MIDELEQWISEELNRAFAELMTAEIEKWVVGDGTGEPLGIMTAEDIELYQLVPEQRWMCRHGEWVRVA